MNRDLIPERLPDDEVYRIASLPLMERQVAIAEAVRDAYQRGWEKANELWAAYVVEDVPGARA